MFSKRTLAILSVLFLALGFASMGVASRWMNEGLGNFSQVFLRITGALLLICILFWKDISWGKISRLGVRDWLIVIAIGTVGYAFMIYAITRAALLTNLISVTILYSTVPFWVYFFSLLMARQRFSWQVASLLIVSSWGIGLISSGQFIPRLGYFGLGEWFALTAAAFDAVWYLGIKLLENKLNSKEITVLALAVASLSTLILLIFKRETIHLSAFSNWHVIIALAFGILQNGWVTPLMSFALRHLNEVVVTQIILAESIFSLLYGYFLFHEIVSPIQILGALIIVSSVYLMNKLQLKPS